MGLLDVGLLLQVLLHAFVIMVGLCRLPWRGQYRDCCGTRMIVLLLLHAVVVLAATLTTDPWRGAKQYSTCIPYDTTIAVTLF